MAKTLYEHAENNVGKTKISEYAGKKQLLEYRWQSSDKSSPISQLYYPYKVTTDCQLSHQHHLPERRLSIFWDGSREVV